MTKTHTLCPWEVELKAWTERRDRDTEDAKQCIQKRMSEGNWSEVTVLPATSFVHLITPP